MTDLQIEYFLKVVECAGFTKAASELYVTQPAISRQISALSDELGFPLFDKVGRMTELTPEGKLFQDLFYRYKEELQKTIEQAKILSGKLFGTIRLGVLESWSLAGFLPDVVSRLQQDYPNIRLVVCRMNVQELRFSLKTKKVDAIIALESMYAGLHGIQSHVFTEIPNILLFSERLPEAQKDESSAADFREYKFFAPDGPQTIEQVKNTCAPYGFEPRIEILPNIESAISEVENGSGVYISDIWSRECQNRQFRYIPLSTQSRIGIAWIDNNDNTLIQVAVNEVLRLFSI
ncbi:MAG: LysR family transcriptional regulator [Clostridiales Family XIII bacterium]|jgi:DNA-binding transcriptional LysR family regulator|nr:LysR family transcriptional regulator [Clostridiales Family XIII bacterium]